MAKTILCIILVITAIVGWIFAVIGFVNQRTGAERVDDFKNTIAELSESNQRLKERYQNLENSYSQLRGNNEQLREAVGRFESGIGDADGALREAFKTIGRLEKVHNAIRN